MKKTLNPIIVECIEKGNVSLLKEYIDSNNISHDLINETDEEGNGYLHILSKNLFEGDIFQIIGVLINCGIMFNSVNENFETPLELAIKNNNLLAIDGLNIINDLAKKDIIQE